MTIDTGAVRLRTEAEVVRHDRLGKRITPSTGDPRSSARHDRDRIYYSRSLLRLAGVTQVMTPSDEGALVHNRLTHTIKVAQVARSMAEVLLALKDRHDSITALGGLDCDVVEAASLAHDLGHPPFGHAGEVVLDRYAREELHLDEGFEGNAQTFRILTTLEPRSSQRVGMDMSAATLAATLKYPWRRHDADRPKTWRSLPKFGFYEDAQSAVERARKWLPPNYPINAQTLEAAVMDVADDITYALHDLEDFRSAGLISLTDVRFELDQWADLYGARVRIGEEVNDEANRFGALRRSLLGDPQYDPGKFEDAVRAASSHLRVLSEFNSPHWRVAQENSRRFISHQISLYLAEMTLNESPSRKTAPLTLAPEHWHLIQILKRVTRDFVIGRADVAAVQRGQQRRLRELLVMLREWIDDSDDTARMPPELKDLWDTHRERGLLDYVASLTDRGAVALHSALTGQGAQSILAGLSL